MSKEILNLVEDLLAAVDVIETLNEGELLDQASMRDFIFYQRDRLRRIEVAASDPAGWVTRVPVKTLEQIAAEARAAAVSGRPALSLVHGGQA
jgi:hypothetical protein